MIKNVPSKREKDYALSAPNEYLEQVYIEDHAEQVKRYLDKGKYDIDFAISICEMVLGHCDKYKFSSDLYISLQFSLKKLVRFLQDEKQPRNKDPVILWTCPKCKESEPIFSSKEENHKCNFCRDKFLGIEKL